jgi:hypothetical protein
LALEEDTGVKEHLQQEPRLTFREAEGGNGLFSRRVGQLNRPAVGRRRQRHRISSSARRGCAARLPPPPRPPTIPLTVT